MGFDFDSRSPDKALVRIRTTGGLFLKVGWEIGMACVIPNRRRDDERIEEKSVHDKSWLLGESGGCGGGAALINADPMTVHSSFRFSLCSQIELDSMTAVSASPSTTVLLVNLGKSRAKERRCRRIESMVERSITPLANALIRFSYGEIVSATANFSKDRVLGRGALSCVFKGKFGIWRRAMAIKRLNKEDKESAKAFSRELMIASSLHNSYIVPLLGFCIDPNEGLFLVYRFVSGGSLEHHLHEKRGKKKDSFVLPWNIRYKVAIGIAKAIAFLHNGTERCVVHRDIKPSNILLSSNKTPKLCDFGLATWTSAPSVTFLCKTVKGTFGYLAPEYFQHGKVSDKTDVYAFGVVLLELLTGRKPIDSKSTRKNNLLARAKALLNEGIKEVLDPGLEANSRECKQIRLVIQAAKACINGEESQRPGITGIIAILKGKQETTREEMIESDLFGYECAFESLQHTSDFEDNSN